MDSQGCCKINQDKFQRLTCEFKNRHVQLFFLLNTLLNIKCFGDRLCYCRNKKECAICKIKRIYVDYEYDFYKNMLNLDFLTKFYSNLVHYLNQLFGTKTPCVFFYQMNTTIFRKIGTMEKSIMSRCRMQKNIKKNMILIK